MGDTDRGELSGIVALLLAQIADLDRRELVESTPQVPIADKLLVTLREAQALTGLSRKHLTKAIAAGQLPSKTIGRGYRFRPEDLKRYIDELWENTGT